MRLKVYTLWDDNMECDLDQIVNFALKLKGLGIGALIIILGIIFKDSVNGFLKMVFSWGTK